MKDMRSLRKADIPAVGAALVWTGVFLAALLAIFCLEGAPTVAHLKGGQIASVAAMEEKTLLELNTADKEELMTLPGIGEKLAEAILDHRKANGIFRKPEELDQLFCLLLIIWFASSLLHVAHKTDRNSQLRCDIF